ncbi:MULTISPECIES: flavin reductase family protein [unclassified Frigoribacterium]|jgi:flavin reductase (DIM6/NTAB) family NADH-FMN oxidoreductase RutF|uniref:flavin reductase family protein n=1 Tax=unclassified Frigoribacterium TaxID=2627005 RepID=UPI0005BDED67|nr:MULTISPECIES: flavin reductase family protein [unclassified Frigoribacterium]KIU03123.1 flavin oxidoreductase [Frigoribacterium sp. MEB024]KQN46002.1 flavin oxidoreductase [Frigoribacterium sp. Leaf44]
MTDDNATTSRPDGSLEAFKDAFRRHAAGVAIVTARDGEGTPVGFTATSLASLAAVPPLATFNMARTASSWPALTETDQVIVHLLGLRNRDLAHRMAGPAAERFAGDHWTDGPNGVPLLTGVTAWMTGTIIERLPVHGNAVVVVRIGTGGVGEDDDALLYHDRRYLRPVHLEG